MRTLIYKVIKLDQPASTAYHLNQQVANRRTDNQCITRAVKLISSDVLSRVYFPYYMNGLIENKVNYKASTCTRVFRIYYISRFDNNFCDFKYKL